MKLFDLFSLRRESSSETDETDDSSSSHSSDHSHEKRSDVQIPSLPSTSAPPLSAIHRSSTSSSLIVDQKTLVLLLYWPQNIGPDNLSEVTRMDAVFRNHYRYTTRIIEIDQRDPFNSINNIILQFQRELQSPDQLLIVYYIGHGSMGDNMRFEMSPHTFEGQNPLTVPKLDRSTLQVILQNLNCDVLILLDTCHAASSIVASSSTNASSRGRTEIIAACGYEAKTPGLDRNLFGQYLPTFSRALSIELQRLSLSPRPFSAAILHCTILERNVFGNAFAFAFPALQQPFNMQMTTSPTPLHVVLGNAWDRPGIPLQPAVGLGLMALGRVALPIIGINAAHPAHQAETLAGDIDLVRNEPTVSQLLAHSAMMTGGNGLGG